MQQHSMLVGQRLCEIREAKNLSQADIEQRTGLLRWYTSRVEKQKRVSRNCRLLLRAGGRDMFHRGHLHVVRGLRHVIVFLHRFFLGNCRTGDFHLMADVWG